MAAGMSTTAELNALYNDIYEDSMVVLREENLMVGGGMSTLYLNGRGYADRKVGIWNRAAVAIKPEGTDFSGTQFEKSLEATFTPQVRMAQFMITDEMKETDDVDVVRGRATSELAGAIAEQIDIDMLALFNSLTTGKGSASNALTVTITSAAVSVLRNQKVRGTRYGVLHPYQWHDLWIELGQPAVQKALLGDVANEALRQYYVTDWIAVAWGISANVEVLTGDDAVGAVFTREAFAYDQRKGYTLETERDASALAEELNASVGYAVGILRNEAGVKLTSDVTEPA